MQRPLKHSVLAADFTDMPKLRTREVDSSPAPCRRCGAMATITIHETRYVRGLGDLLDKGFDPAATRTASCSACATRYPIRGTDRTAKPAAARRDATDEPTGREWGYADRRAEDGAAQLR